MTSDVWSDFQRALIQLLSCRTLWKPWSAETGTTLGMRPPKKRCAKSTSFRKRWRPGSRGRRTASSWTWTRPPTPSPTWATRRSRATSPASTRTPARTGSSSCWPPRSGRGGRRASTTAPDGRCGRGSPGREVPKPGKTDITSWRLSSVPTDVTCFGLHL